MNLNENIPEGIYCFRFYSYLSDFQSNGSIEILIEDINNKSIILIQNNQFHLHQWNEIRRTFQIYSSISKVILLFIQRFSFIFFKSLDLFCFQSINFSTKSFFYCH